MFIIQEFCIRLLCGRFHQDGSPEIEDAEIEAIEHSPDYLSVIFEHYQYGQGWISMSVMLITAIREEVTRYDFTLEFSKLGVTLDWGRIDAALGFLVKFGVLEEFKPGHYRILSNYLREAIMTREPFSLLDGQLRKRSKKKGK